MSALANFETFCEQGALFTDDRKADFLPGSTSVKCVKIYGDTSK